MFCCKGKKAVIIQLYCFMRKIHVPGIYKKNTKNEQYSLENGLIQLIVYCTKFNTDSLPKID